MAKGLIIGIIFGILFFGLIITGLIIASQKGLFSNENKNKSPQSIKIFIQGRDMKTAESIDSNYIISSINNEIISQGSLKKDEWTEISVPLSALKIYCWNKDYYLVQIGKTFSNIEIQYNSSKFTCDMVKFSNLSISHAGDLSQDVNIISLNLSTSDWFSKPEICVAWTAGILTVYPKEAEITCPNSNWLNWSYFNNTIKQYVWLNQDTYRCGDCQDSYCEWTETCQSANSNQCLLFGTQIPLRFKGKADRCWKIGASFYNSSIIKDFVVKTENLNQLDKVDFYVIDKDRRVNYTTNNLDWLTEDLKGNNIGADDFKYTIFIN